MDFWRKICFIALAITLLLGISAATVQASGQVNISVDGTIVETDVPPFIDENGRTMVPVRFVSEALGCVVGWNAEEQRVRITRTGIAVDLYIGQKTAHIKGIDIDGTETKEMDTTAVLKAGRTMVPLRFLAETFGLKVDWKEEQRTVAIESPAPPPQEEASAPWVGIVTGNNVNIRSGPGTNYNPPLTQVNAGTRLTILADGDGPHDPG